MNIIRDQLPVVATLLGKQEVDPAGEYRRMTFCKIMTVDGQRIVYHSLTGTIAEISAEEEALLAAETLSFTEALCPLIENWFLVRTDHNDMQLADEFLAMMELFEKKDGFKTYTILPTMDCNARCYYCYELGRPRISMSEATADDVVTFIRSTCAEGKIRLRWFGGEPLYNVAIMDRICDGLRAAGIEFQSSITTNGYLFDEATVQKAVDVWHLQKAQITLDGTEEIYNRTKAYIYKDTGSAFVRVTDNIERLLSHGIRVSIRMNMSEKNKEDLYRLVEWLAERYRGCKGLSVYAHLLFETDFEKADSTERIRLVQAMRALEARCVELGLSAKRVLGKEIRTNHCMADSARAIIVLPNGKLSKCEHFTEDNFVGDIYSGVTDLDKVAEFRERINSHEMCAGCFVYPHCIRLKKCPSAPLDFCPFEYRSMEEDALIQQAKNTYLHEKKKAE